MNRLILTAAAFGVALVLGQAPPTSAGTPLQPPAGAMTLGEKKPATFSHAVHTGIGLACGACHHNAKREPLTAEQITTLASGAELACASCHREGFSNPKLIKRMDLFHAACRDCHQQGVDGRKGPTRCNDCHTSR